MIRRALALAVVLAAAIVPAPADGTAAPVPAPLADERFVDVALGPLEAVVPVAPSPSETARSAVAAPTAVSGATLAWPRLHLGETGTVSTYGPGYRGYLALPYPWGAGWRVTVCGPGGCVTAVSNDYGPVRELRRLVDLDVPTFERVCGVPWRFGLCTATVTVLGRAE